MFFDWFLWHKAYQRRTYHKVLYNTKLAPTSTQKDKSAVWCWFENLNSFEVSIYCCNACETDSMQLQAPLISVLSQCIYIIVFAHLHPIPGSNLVQTYFHSTICPFEGKAWDSFITVAAIFKLKSNLCKS